MEEEIINKPENQFKAILNDIIDYPNHGKNALIKELTQRPKQTTKPASSLSSSTYSSAASSTSSTASSSSSSSSSSSTSSTSESTNSSSSTSSSTLSSPSQSSQTNISNNKFNNNNKTSNNSSNDTSNSESDKIEIAKIEDLRKKARIIHQGTTRKGELCGSNLNASPSHSDSKSSLKQNSNINNNYRPTLMNIDLAQQHNQQQTNSNNLTHESSTTTATQWKTIGVKRDKRRKKPVEQPVLSEHIPGHKGEQEVDWLVNFIESGTTNGVGSSNKNNTKSRPQNKIDSNNHNTVTRNNNPKNSNYTTSAQVTTNNGQNIKKNENFPVNNQKQNPQTSSKMNTNTNQVKDTPQPNNQQINHQSQAQQNVMQSETRKPIETNNRDRSQQQQPQPQIQQQPATTQQQPQLQRTKIIISNKPPQQMRQHFKSLSNNQNSPSSLNSNQRKMNIQPIHQSQPIQQHLESSNQSSENKQMKRSVLTHSERHLVSQLQQPQQQQNQPHPRAPSPLQQLKQQQQPSQTSGPLDEDVVTFADHLKVNDKESSYTFGFFDEQPGNKQAKVFSEPSKTKQEPSSQEPNTNQIGQLNKHQEASPNREQKRYKFNDNIDANSFNYNQILEFISNAWEKNKKSQSGKACNNRILYAR